MGKHPVSSDEHALPKEKIDKVIDPIIRFMHIESASGVVLVAATVIAIVLANSGFADAFLGLWKTYGGIVIGEFTLKMSLQHWINDLLMAVFFFVIGLEVKREIVSGELSDMRRASLPIFAAIGGMVVPAAVYLFFQAGEPGADGWGIPMATDIAFVVGVIALLGPRIPRGLRVLLLSLAIADDIGAILVIAIGYTENLNLASLLWGAVFIGVFLGMMKLGIKNVAVYTVVALIVWYFVYKSGIHATIAGVIIGLLTPTSKWVSDNRLAGIVQSTLGWIRGEEWESSEQRYHMLRQVERASRKAISPLQRFETDLHPWVSYFIMPVFALANAGVAIQLSSFADPVAVAVALGLLIGKPVGIVLLSFIAVKIGLARLPEGVTWSMVVGGGFLAGIGFTMALFIAGLALEGIMLDAAKIGIIAGSFVSAIIGAVILLMSTKKPEEAAG
ncbi:Na+/H+ antiporter NhaA [bacterium]|nr:Na+/H+ antiporter NhaA [bacterium]